MAVQIINVNSEMNQMKQYIGDISHCKNKINEIAEKSGMYKINEKINVLTIVATVYMLICAIMQYNHSLVLLVVGILIAMLTAYVLLKENSSSLCKGCCILLCAMILLSIVCFLYRYDIIFALTSAQYGMDSDNLIKWAVLLPVIITSVEWIVVVISNFRMKNLIWKISNTV